jgi:hypothetical protein
MDETAIDGARCPGPSAPAARAAGADAGRGQRTRAQPSRTPLTLRWGLTPASLRGVWGRTDGRAPALHPRAACPARRC